jgi:hypothetical protein
LLLREREVDESFINGLDRSHNPFYR